MKQCPVSHLQVSENPEWIAPHIEHGYTTVFSLIGRDIVHLFHSSTPDTISLSGIDSTRFRAIMQKLELTETQLFMLINLEKVTEISYQYRKDFLNFAFNWGRNIRMIVMYNVDKEIRKGLERFCLIAPENTRMTCVGSYREAVEIIMRIKNNSNHPDPISQYPTGMSDVENELWRSMARISLQHLLNQPIYPPSSDHALYPYFIAIEAFRKDMAAKEHLFRENRSILEKKYEQHLRNIRTQLQHEIDMHTTEGKKHQQAIMTLKTAIRLNQEEIDRLKITTEEKNSRITSLCSQLKTLGHSALSETFFSTIHHEETNASIPELHLDADDNRFLESMKQSHPFLNGRELKVCLFIRKNVPSKTVAQICGTSIRGMENIRYRLHKKLGLGKHLSIKKYLRSL